MAAAKAANAHDFIVQKPDGYDTQVGERGQSLSSGERQRAAVAAVLPGTPRLVLLDEPTRGMDAGARGALVRLIDRLREHGAAIVIATHDAELRAAVADTVLMVAAGKVSAVADEALHR